ncbi:MAG: patatin-like phospholipase family protein [Rhodothermales bacterium]|nr:patatin-like phospholipase family protein [Rhodothermales bacterium]
MDTTPPLSPADRLARGGRPVLGLVLGGGGARGLSHIGVLKVLEREGLEPDVLAGASMGGLLGAAYASGVRAERLEQEILNLSRASKLIRLADWIPTVRALFSGRKFEAFLTKQMGADLRFGDLRRPLALTTVDLHSGREVVFTEGSVVAAMRATMSIPGVFAPVEHGPYRLVDGGILNNVPVDLARELGAEVVVAVDVLPYFSENRPGEPAAVDPLEPPLLPRGVRDVWQAAFIAVSALTECNLDRTRPEVEIRPALPTDVTLLYGFTRAEELIAAGAAAAEAALPDLRAALAERTAPAS